MRLIKKSCVILMLMAALTTFSSACTSTTQTNMPGLSWQYCSNINQINVRNAGDRDVFVRLKIVTDKGPEWVTATIHSGHIWTRPTTNAPSKVVVTDWVLYNKH